ncbi:hypothetical protein GO730_32455 [Spirosoma sp. HMF3257]|uniref:Uncharacterized protein n=1 Tax=Spirosoma telluris TaxID=2183553 RepID=A0A327NQT9_9BACT|nr:hypothetical protein [Spirosoma telluris]RAI77662.1 hypothetical protein HMF3257_32355 [Spirosoma telluris]
MILNGQWKAKLNALNDAAQTADPNNDGIVDTQTAYNQWQTASAEAKAAQSKHGLFVACVGLATGAALLETYLLLHKPKPVKGLSIQPASQSVGIALRFDF